MLQMHDERAFVAQSHKLSPPRSEELFDARERLRSYLEPTPLRAYPSLGELVGAQVWVKHDNFLPTGAFKVRGGINLVSRLDETERRAGVACASTGNHGQSIAYAARLFDVPCTVYVPENANPTKVAAIGELGAEVVFHGRDFDDARERCEEESAANGRRYVHSGNEPLLIAGVATHTLELLEQEPPIDTIVVPIGGGSGAAGACLAVRAVGADAEVIGVQSEAAPAAYRTWQERRLVEDAMATSAEGLATRTAFELPQRVLWEHLTDFVLVSEEELRTATRLMIEKTRTLVEAAGASPLAAALRLGDRLRDRRVALLCTGGNATLAQLREVLVD
jgi:threonine dehydratase